MSLSHVALPTEPVLLSAPGGPPEKSALSASVLQGAVTRTPCSPIPGVGRLLSHWVHLSINACVCSRFLQFKCGVCNTHLTDLGTSSQTVYSVVASRAQVCIVSCVWTVSAGMHPPGPPLARPILPKDRGAMDRVIEYLVGDGPQNRWGPFLRC